MTCNAADPNQSKQAEAEGEQEEPWLDIEEESVARARSSYFLTSVNIFLYLEIFSPPRLCLSTP